MFWKNYRCPLFLKRFDRAIYMEDIDWGFISLCDFPYQSHRVRRKIR
jgi:hypothetical protein